MVKTLWMIEDEKRIVKLVRDYMEKDNFQVVSAADTVEGLEVYRRQDSDFI